MISFTEQDDLFEEAVRIMRWYARAPSGLFDCDMRDRAAAVVKKVDGDDVHVNAHVTP